MWKKRPYGSDHCSTGTHQTRAFKDDDDLGYSIAEKSKLADNPKARKHTVFEEDDNDGHESDHNTCDAYFQKKEHEFKKRGTHLTKAFEKDDDVGYSVAEKSKLKNASNRKHVVFEGEDSDDNDKSDDYKKSPEDGDSNDSDDEDSDDSVDEDSDDSDEESRHCDDEESEHSSNEIEDSGCEDTDMDYSSFSMGELLKLQEEMGVKAFKEKVLKVQKTDDRNSAEKKSFKRLNKNRPSEMPLMRRTAPRMNSLLPSRKVKSKFVRDPRFDDLSGTLIMNAWDKQYGFLKETRQKEMEVLKKELQGETNPHKKEKLKKTLQRMKNQRQESVKRDRENVVKELDKKQQLDALRKGKKPRYMTEKEKQTILKTMHHEQLKKDNKLDKHLQRKEKRQARRERLAME